MAAATVAVDTGSVGGEWGSGSGAEKYSCDATSKFTTSKSIPYESSPSKSISYESSPSKSIPCESSLSKSTPSLRFMAVVKGSDTPIFIISADIRKQTVRTPLKYLEVSRTPLNYLEVSRYPLKYLELSMMYIEAFNSLLQYNIQHT